MGNVHVHVVCVAASFDALVRFTDMMIRQKNSDTSCFSAGEGPRTSLDRQKFVTHDARTVSSDQPQQPNSKLLPHTTITSISPPRASVLRQPNKNNQTKQHRQIEIDPKPSLPSVILEPHPDPR